MRVMPIVQSVLVALVGLSLPAQAVADRFRLRDLSADAIVVSSTLAGIESAPPVMTFAVAKGPSAVLGWERIGLTLSGRLVRTGSDPAEVYQVGIGIEVAPVRTRTASVALGGGIHGTLVATSSASDSLENTVDIELSSAPYGEVRVRWMVDPDTLNFIAVLGWEYGQSNGGLPVNFSGLYGGLGFGIVF